MRTALLLGMWVLVACSADAPARSGERGQASIPTVPVTSPSPTAGSTAGAVGPVPLAGAGSNAGSGAPVIPVSGNAGRRGPGRGGPGGGSPAAAVGGSGSPLQPSAAGSAGPRPGAGPSAGCGKPAGMTGMFQAQIRAFDLDRGYYMSVPQNYDPERAHRLVFGYHGSNYTGKMMRQYLDNEKAPLLDGTIFVYPDGLPLPNEPDNVAWVLDAKGRDLAFFDALYESVRTSYCIDETRVFVNGQSFGALMTNFVGCQRGDIVRAIAAVAGSGPYGSSCQGKVAVWLTHGMDDMNVQFSAGEASRAFWVKANGCTEMTVPGEPMQCLNYQGCDPEHPVIWCPHVNDGGHQHPSFGRKAARDFLASF
jgi:poly(3-hydroxybutyrate) depolymerase